MLLGCNDSVIHFEEPAFTMSKTQLHKFDQLVLGRSQEGKPTQALSAGKDRYDVYLYVSAPDS